MATTAYVAPPERVAGDGVMLRKWTVDDAETVFAIVSESSAHIVPWMPWAAGYTPDSARDFVVQNEAGWATGDDLGFAILDETGHIAGAAGMHRRIGPGGIELGYWLRPSFTGRGLATRAMAALTAAAFDLPGIDRVEIHHDAANARSEGIPARLGFIEVSRQPREPQAPAEVGIEVVWRMLKPGAAVDA